MLTLKYQSLDMQTLPPTYSGASHRITADLILSPLKSKAHGGP